MIRVIFSVDFAIKRIALFCAPVERHIYVENCYKTKFTHLCEMYKLDFSKNVSENCLSCDLKSSKMGNTNVNFTFHRVCHVKPPLKWDEFQRRA